MNRKKSFSDEVCELSCPHGPAGAGERENEWTENQRTESNTVPTGDRGFKFWIRSFSRDETKTGGRPTSRNTTVSAATRRVLAVHGQFYGTTEAAARFSFSYQCTAVLTKKLTAPHQAQGARCHRQQVHASPNNPAVVSFAVLDHRVPLTGNATAIQRKTVFVVPWSLELPPILPGARWS